MIFCAWRFPKSAGIGMASSLVVHISPGTPSMQTVWVLMAETGDRAARRTGEDLPGGGSAARRTHGGWRPCGPIRFSRFTSGTNRSPALSTRRWNGILCRFQSARLKAVYAEARRFAQVKVPLLILGERGNGQDDAGGMGANLQSVSPENDPNPPVVPCGQYVKEPCGPNCSAT